MEQNKKEYLRNKLLNYVPEMLCAINEEGCFMAVGGASLLLLGYNWESLEGTVFYDYVLPEDVSQTLSTFQAAKVSNKSSVFTCHHKHKGGETISIQWYIDWSEADKLFFCTASDPLSHNPQTRSESKKAQIYQVLMEHGADMVGIIDETGKYLYIGGNISRILGYTPMQLVGINAFSLIHPEDIVKVEGSLAKVGSTEFVQPADFRFKAANGEWRWIEAIISNQLHNTALKALVVNSRDITDQKIAHLKLQESEQRYKALFDNNPDVIFLENLNGLITEVNKAFENVFGLKAEEVAGKPASFFLSPDMAFVNAMSLQHALSGSTMRCDLTITTKDNEQKVFDKIKFPVTVNGEIVGVQSVAKDITPIVRSYNLIEQQAKKLSTILESISDAFFTIDTDWRFSYINSVFSSNRGYSKEEIIGKNIWEVFPEMVPTLFYRKCMQSSQSDRPNKFEESYADSGCTYRYSIYPSTEGLSVYYTDITKEKKMQQELEKLSLVASATDNAVLITDADGLTEWVNKGFTKTTGYTLLDMLGKKPGEVLQGEDTDEKTVEEISRKLKQGVSFNTVLINYRKSGEKFWFSMDISPIYDEGGNITQFIAIQRDVTNQKQVDANIKKMTDDLFAHNRDLKEFTYIVSHNLRAPVANALGLANLLTKNPKLAATNNLPLVHLKTSILKMDTVLKDVNMILSIRERQDVLGKEAVRLFDLFEQSLLLVQEPILKAGGDVFVAIDKGVTIYVHKPYLHSVFYNLLTNAIRFRSETRQLKVEVRCFYNSEGEIVIYFSDNGVGFDLKMAGDNVFKLYKTFHRVKSGRGIGLFMIKTHIQAMGGRINVSSQVNVGTAFHIYIPAQVE